MSRRIEALRDRRDRRVVRSLLGRHPKPSRISRALSSLIVASSLLTGCASESWTRADTLREFTAESLFALDALQTADIHKHEGASEVGWARGVCGQQPSNSCTAGYFGSVMLTHYLIARMLPASWRAYWQGGAVAVQLPTVLSNYKLGVGPR